MIKFDDEIAAKFDWKVGDWAVVDMDIVQIKQLEPYVVVTTGIINTSGQSNLLDRLRPLTVRNKIIVETFDYYYKELRKIRGNGGFNYPDISQLFSQLALQCIDAADGTEDFYRQAQDFIRLARDYKPVIHGVHLFR
jgi:hypothetical protein